MQVTKRHYHFAKYSLCRKHKKYRIALVRTIPINRGPIRPCFHGTDPVLRNVKSSDPVSRKILLRTPNIRSFFQVIKMRLLQDVRTF